MCSNVSNDRGKVRWISHFWGFSHVLQNNDQSKEAKLESEQVTCILAKVVDTVPVSIYCIDTCTDIETPMFRTDLNTGHTNCVPGIPADIDFFIFFYIYFFKFCNFWILLGQNDNLLALTY